MIDMPDRSTDVVIVQSCTRDGRGGSPTAIVPVVGPHARHARDDEARTALAASLPASHTAFVHLPRSRASDPVRVRFFTRTGELQGCGHGTIAVHAYLALTGAARPGRSVLAIGGRQLEVTGALMGDEVEARFGHGTVHVEAVDSATRTDVLAALGVSDRPAVVARPGAPRLLVDVGDRATLAALRPDHEALAAVTGRYGLLGCLAYVIEQHTSGHHAGSARMFAPAIGVDEDIANVNSTAGLAAALAASEGSACRLTLDQGDPLGVPSTITAQAVPTTDGIRVTTGGRARLAVAS